MISVWSRNEPPWKWLKRPLPSEDPISYDHVIRTSSNSDSEHHKYMHHEKAFATRKTVGIPSG